MIREYLASIGRKGGKARAAKYDKAMLSKWAKKGGRPPKSKEGNKPCASTDAEMCGGTSFDSGGRLSEKLRKVRVGQSPKKRNAPGVGRWKSPSIAFRNRGQRSLFL